MADANRGKRPLSPHISIYRPQMTSVLSILHRITGAGLALTALLIVWWFAAAATGAEYFGFVDGVLTSWFGIAILLISLLGFWFHFFNGLRHLRWDAGVGLGLGQAARTGVIVLVLAIAMSIVVVVLAV